MGEWTAGSTIILNAPSGFEFDPSATVAISKSPGASTFSAGFPLGVSSTQIGVTVSIASDQATAITFSGIKVRPTTQTPSSENITVTGTAGVTGDAGALTTVAGTVTKLVFTTQPSLSTVHGSVFAQQPVVKTQDQFGNNSTSGLAASNNVIISLNGAGTLSGSATLDIGTGTGNGTATYTDLYVKTVGSGKTLTATPSTYAPITSDAFAITNRPITITADPAQTKVYGQVDPGAYNYSVTLGSLAPGDAVNGLLSRAVGEAVGAYAISQGALTAGSNYLETFVPADFTVTAKNLTVSNVTASNKPYDGTTSATLDFTGALLTGVEAGDVGNVTINSTLASGVFADANAGAGKTVNVTGVTLSGTASGNYTVSQPTGVIATITKINQTALTLTGPASATYGTTPTLTTAGGSGTGTVTYSVGVFTGCTVLGDVLTVTNVGGTCDVTATKAADTNYNVASSIATAVTLVKATPTVTLTVSNSPVTYNAGAQSALVGQSGASTPGAVASILTGGAATKTNAGTYPVTANFVPNDAVNYSTITAQSAGDFVIDKATPTVTLTVSNSPVTYNAGAQFALVGQSGASTPGAVASILTGGAATKTNADTYPVTANFVPNDAVNYSTITAQSAGDFVIATKTLTVSATGVNKEYNADTTATVTLSDDRLSGDVVTLAYTTATFADKNVGTGKNVSVSGISITGGAQAGNYTLGNTTASATANITATPLTATLNLNNKTYDGDTSVAYSSSNPHVVLSGIISGDDVTVNSTGSKSFLDKNVGTNKPVAATGITIQGVDAGNYQFDGTGTGTSAISTRPITITAATDSKTYNGTNGSAGTPVVTNTGILTSGPIMGTDVASFTQTYDNKNVGTGKTLTATGSVTDDNSGNNYSYTFVTNTTGVIIAKAINVTAQTDSKEYDGTNASSVAPVVGTLEIGDTVIGGTAPTQSYDTKDVDTGKTMMATGLIVNDGNNGNNYSVAYVDDVTGEIIAKNLTISGVTASNKTYDGTTSATLGFGVATLVGVESGDIVTIDSTSALGAFTNANAGPNKAVTITLVALSGSASGNYTVSQPTGVTATISQATPVITWVTPADISAGTALGGSQLNASATGVGGGALGGTFVYTPTSGTVFTTAGTSTLSTNFTPTDAVNYNSVNGTTVTLNVIPASISQLEISASPTPLDISAPSTLTVTGKDQYGNTVTNNSTTVVVLHADNGGALATSLLTLTNGVKTTTLTKTNSGVVNVNVSSGILTPAQTVVTFTSTAPDTTAPITSAIAVILAQTTASVAFTSDEAGTAKVGYGLTSIHGNVTSYSSMISGANTIGLTGLTCGTTYHYSVYGKDGSNNESNSTDATFATTACTTGDTTAPDAPVITTATATVNADFYTISGTVTAEIASTQVVRVLIDSNVYGTVIIPKNGTTWSVAVALPQSTATTFKATSADEAGNVSNDSNTVVITESATAGQGNGTFGMGSPTMIKLTGTADDSYSNGWEWTIRMTLPTDQNNFALKFNNWTSGSNTLLVANNTQYYSEQIASGVGSVASPITISAVNAYPSNVTVITDVDPTTPGIQTDIHVKVKIPSSTVDGSYSTSYRVNYQGL